MKWKFKKKMELVKLNIIALERCSKWQGNLIKISQVSYCLMFGLNGHGFKAFKIVNNQNWGQLSNNSKNLKKETAYHEKN